jgi:hypothetical protein
VPAFSRRSCRCRRRRSYGRRPVCSALMHHLPSGYWEPSAEAALVPPQAIFLSRIRGLMIMTTGGLRGASTTYQMWCSLSATSELFAVCRSCLTGDYIPTLAGVGTEGALHIVDAPGTVQTAVSTGIGWAVKRPRPKPAGRCGTTERGLAPQRSETHYSLLISALGDDVRRPMGILGAYERKEATMPQDDITSVRFRPPSASGGRHLGSCRPNGHRTMWTTQTRKQEGDVPPPPVQIRGRIEGLGEELRIRARRESRLAA